VDGAGDSGNPPLPVFRGDAVPPGLSGWLPAGFQTLKRSLFLPFQPLPRFPRTLSILIPDLLRYAAEPESLSVEDLRFFWDFCVKIPFRKLRLGDFVEPSGEPPDIVDARRSADVRELTIETSD
jgi:hypothetical protein